MEKIGAAKAIKTYFGQGESAREVTFAELKALSNDERFELGRLCAIELGKELEVA